jgi:GlpG protein
MRNLADASDGDEAKRIVDALVAAGIDAQVRSDTEVWVIDHDQLEAARARLEAVRAGEVDLELAAARAEELRKRAKKEASDHRQRIHDMRRRWGPTSMPGPGLVTTFLIVGSVIVGVIEWLGDGSGLGMWNLTIDHFASTEPLQRVREGEVWRLVTPIFLHFGLLHLAFNMLWLYRLGGQVEHGHGPLVMVLVVLASALPGNLGQYAATGPAFGGMSGVVYGLFGFVWMHARFSRDRPYSISDVDTVLMMLWFLACATGGFGPIANIGHAAGLVAGLLFGLPPYLRHLRTPGTRPDFAEGSWAAENLRGFRRVNRRFIAPFVPLWFLALAAGVIVLEERDESVPDYEYAACEQIAVVINTCAQALPEPRLDDLLGDLYALTRERDQPECREMLTEVLALASEAGCAPADAP